MIYFAFLSWKVVKYQPNYAFVLKTNEIIFFLLKFYLYVSYQCPIQRHRSASIFKIFQCKKAKVTSPNRERENLRQSLL